MRQILLLLLCLIFAATANAQVRVKGYTKANGTYVAPHYRSSPNRSKADNYSTKGNYNPYTGTSGTVNPYPKAATGYSVPTYAPAASNYSAADVAKARYQAEQAYWERQKAWEELQIQQMRQRAATDLADGLRSPKSLSDSEFAAYQMLQLQQRFRGNNCTDDCSGHEAGYQWAEDHDISDAGDCGGNSASFIEGCEAYAEDGEQ